VLGFHLFGETGSCRAGLGNENPDVGIAFFTGIASRVNAIDPEVLIRSQGRDQLALSGLGVEAPAVVSAFDLLTIELATVERHAAMGTGVAQRER